MALQIIHKDNIFNVGDAVRIHQRVTETGPKGDRVRIQFFEGLVIATRGHGDNKSFTVRRIGAGGIGIERIFPLNSPLIEKVDVVSKGRVRRAKLYYLREKSAKEVADVTKRYTRLKTAQAISTKKVKSKKKKAKKRA
ncbi:MAG: 50S ribosomal protein L19 [Patescibacteria group bacterium]